MILDNIFVSDFPLANKFKSSSDIRIKFISGTLPFNGRLHVNPAYWSIKSYYKRHGKNNQKITWLDSLQCDIGLDEESIEQIIIDEDPQILCFGIYLWNHDLYSRLGKFIKRKFPNIVIIGGGAQIYAHKDLHKFWRDYRWLDAVAYGDGETAFVSLIDAMIDFEQLSQTVTNVSFKNDKGYFLQPFKRFKDDDFRLISPFIDNKDEISQTISRIKKLVSDDIAIVMNWEFTKGCPYKCSFCDWSSGLHHKITRKKYDWKLDLDFFTSIDISARWVDANVGMFDDDIEILKHAYHLEDTNDKFHFIGGNLAKLHKKAAFEMIDFIETVRPGKKVHIISPQDIHEDILSNIDRPDVPWQEHKRYINDIQQKHPNSRFNLEMMIGLPGQTLESTAGMIIEFGRLNAVSVLGHLWCLLVNSPGYDIDYQRLHGIRVEPAWYFNQLGSEISSRDEIIDKLDYCECWTADFVVGTNTCSLSDIMAMNSMVYFYNSISKSIKNQKKLFIATIERTLGNLRFWQEIGDDIANRLEIDLQNYGKMLFLPNVTGKPLTFDQYFADAKILQTVMKSSYKDIR